MGSCNAKLKSKKPTKKPESNAKLQNKGFINVYDLSGSLAGNIESNFFYFSHQNFKIFPIFSDFRRSQRVKYKI